MKYILYILFSILSSACVAQPSQARIILSKTQELQDVVFRTKDSAKLESLLAAGLTYGHSSGKIQTRQEAIQGIVHNKSTYTISFQPGAYDFSTSGDSAIVKKVFIATEKKADGTEAALNLKITFVWIKESGEWKLIRRQAVKNQ